MSHICHKEQRSLPDRRLVIVLLSFFFFFFSFLFCIHLHISERARNVIFYPFQIFILEKLRKADDEKKEILPSAEQQAALSRLHLQTS